MAHPYPSFGYFSWLRRVGGLLLALVMHYQAGTQYVPAAGGQPGSAPPNSLNLGFGVLRVRLANLDVTTNGASDGYQDYSCCCAARLDRGATYQPQVGTERVVEENVRVWINCNQNGTFDLAAEQVLAFSGKEHLGTFTVPADLPVGASLHLRIATDLYSPGVQWCGPPA